MPTTLANEADLSADGDVGRNGNGNDATFERLEVSGDRSASVPSDGDA